MNDQPSWTSNRRSFLRAGGVGVATVTAGCSTVREVVDPPHPAKSPSGEQNWPEYRYDPGNTGYHPHATVPKEGVELAWHHPTDLPVYSMPTVIDGLVYYGTQTGYHVAANARNGRILWKEKTAVVSIPQNGSALAWDDVVFMGNGDLDARDPATGEKLWAYWGYREGGEKGYVLGSPKMVNGVIYLSIWDNVFAFDPERRESLWRFSTRWRVESTPAVGTSMVFATDSSDILYAIGKATETLNWQFRAEEPGTQTAVSAAYRDGIVFYTAPDDTLYAIEEETGDVRWTCESRFDPPTVTDSRVYVADGSLLAVDADTGDVDWRYTPDEFGRSVNGVSSTRETVICTCNCQESVSLGRQTGEVIWRHPFKDTGASVGSAVAGDMIVVNGGDGVYAFRST